MTLDDGTEIHADQDGIRIRHQAEIDGMRTKITIPVDIGLRWREYHDLVRKIDQRDSRKDGAGG